MKTIILTENQIRRVIDNVINESEEISGFNVDFENVFNSGQYKINPNYEKTIVTNIRKIYDYIQQKQIVKFKLIISASESQVPNPINPETNVRFEKGELASERSKVLKKYLEILIPRTLNIGAPEVIIDTPKIGDVKWDGSDKNAEKYKKDQYVKVSIQILETKTQNYERKSNVQEPIYLNNRLIGLISEPLTDTQKITNPGIKNLGRQELIFTEVVPDTQPPKVVSKFKIPFEWWNNERSYPTTKYISNDDFQYIKSNFPKIS